MRGGVRTAGGAGIQGPAGPSWSLHEALVYSGIAANATGVAKQDITNQHLTFGYKYTPENDEVAYGVAFWYVVYDGPNDVTVGIYRVSDDALIASASRTGLTSADVGVVEVEFADATLSAGVAYYIVYYLTGVTVGYWVSVPTSTVFASGAGVVLKSEGPHPGVTVEGYYHVGEGIASPTSSSGTPAAAIAAMLR